MKPSMDETLHLQELMEQPGFKPLMREADEVVKLFYKDVLSLNLDESTQFKLCLLKSRADGAAQFLTALQSRLEKIKTKQID